MCFDSLISVSLLLIFRVLFELKFIQAIEEKKDSVIFVLYLFVLMFVHRMISENEFNIDILQKKNETVDPGSNELQPIQGEGQAQDNMDKIVKSITAIEKMCGKKRNLKFKFTLCAIYFFFAVLFFLIILGSVYFLLKGPVDETAKMFNGTADDIHKAVKKYLGTNFYIHVDSNATTEN